MTLESKKIIVTGGTSGIGLATALLFQQAGASVTVTGRNIEKLNTAKHKGLQTAQVDSSDSDTLNSFFEGQGNIDHLIIAVGSTKGLGNFRDMALADLRVGFEEKYWSQLNTLKAALPYIDPKGSITLITAITGRAKMPGTSGIGSINGALEIFVPILAKELKPIRMNAVSPGVVDTPWWDFLPQAVKKESFENYASQIAVGRIAQPEDIAQAILFLAESEYISGEIIAMDGGLS
jgi:NAD(P)-dependent dehydrogenase (short-subunit alcohol dehydrogenase family)